MWNSTKMCVAFKYTHQAPFTIGGLESPAVILAMIPSHCKVRNAHLGALIPNETLNVMRFCCNSVTRLLKITESSLTKKEQKVFLGNRHA